jgi:hypothetical protein
VVVLSSYSRYTLVTFTRLSVTDRAGCSAHLFARDKHGKSTLLFAATGEVYDLIDKARLAALMAQQQQQQQQQEAPSQQEQQRPPQRPQPPLHAEERAARLGVQESLQTRHPHQAVTPPLPLVGASEPPLTAAGIGTDAAPTVSHRTPPAESPPAFEVRSCRPQVTSKLSARSAVGQSKLLLVS